MPYKQPNRRNSINPRDIIGNNIAGGGVSVVSSAGGGSTGAGRTLIAEYSSTTTQSVLLPSKVQTNAALNTPTAVLTSTLVSTTTPFLLIADADRALYVECELTFTPSANSGRYVLALQTGTATSAGDEHTTFRAITRGTTRTMYLDGTCDMLLSDRLQLVFRAYNNGNASEMVNITEARVWVYSV